jgi:hypothetical protein
MRMSAVNFHMQSADHVRKVSFKYRCLHDTYSPLSIIKVIYFWPKTIISCKTGIADNCIHA